MLSRTSLGAALVAGLAGLIWMLQTAQTAGQSRTAGDALVSARVVATGVVQPALTDAALDSGRLPAAAAATITAGIEALRRDGHLSALSIWRSDGFLLFQDAPVGSPQLSVTPEQLRHVRSGNPWTTAAGNRDDVRVFLPLRVAGANGAVGSALVGVVIPRPVVAQAAEDQLLRREIGAVSVFVLLAGGLVWQRRRLLRRDEDARRDPLTGLLNRRALREDAPAMLAAASDDRPLGLLLIDLAAFKSVNDTLGHAAGDQLLEQVSTTLTRSVRAGDVVVRLGGDEFAVLLPGLSSPTDGGRRAEQLLHTLRQASFTVEGLELTVDASIGVAVAPQHGAELPDLLKHADVAMYTAKAAHAGIQVYNATDDDHTVGALAMVAELRRAIDGGQFVLHYQPKIALPHGDVTGVEALIRWQHPSRGLLAPGEFLPLAESAGLMSDISRWVLSEAVHQAASWMRAGMPVKVAVNISPRGLLDYDLPARALSALLSADLPASLLEIEITETAVTTNPERAAYILTQLRGRGIDVAIDDFGAGYTSLAFLRVLPATALKIDRGLITNMLQYREDEAIAAAVIDLAHRLGMQVIAEGVETEDLRRRLTELGCDQAQGYGISRPMTAGAVAEWLAARQGGCTAPSVGAVSVGGREGSGYPW